MKLRIKVPQAFNDRLFLIIFGLYCYESILDSSLLSIHTFTNALRLIISFIGLFIFLANNIRSRTSIKRLLFILVLVILFFVAALKTDREYLIVFALFILLGERIDFDHIVKISLFSSVLALITIFFFCWIGLLKDYIYQTGGRSAHCFGFSYYSAVPFIVFFCTVMSLYLNKRRVSIGLYLLVLLVNTFMYYMTTLRLTFYLAFIVVFIDYAVKRFSKIKLDKKWLLNITPFLFPLGMIITYLCMRYYTPTNRNWLVLNSILNSRLRQMSVALSRYPISFFGNYMEMHGNSAVRTVAFEYFYVDSGFAYALLGYGLLFSIIVVFLYSIIYKYACETNNKSLFVWVTAVLLFTMINNTWVSLQYNPLLMISMHVLRVNRMKKRVKQTSEALGNMTGLQQIN